MNQNKLWEHIENKQKNKEDYYAEIHKRRYL